MICMINILFCLSKHAVLVIIIYFLSSWAVLCYPHLRWHYLIVLTQHSIANCPGVHPDGGAPGPISKNINLKPQTPGVHPDGGGQELGGEQRGVQVGANHQWVRGGLEEKILIYK